MSIARRIAKNSLASLIAKLSTPLSSFVLVFMIARSLGASVLGEYSAALSLLFIFQAVVSLGFPYLITKDVAQDHAKADRYLTNASFVSILFAVVTAIIMCLVIHMITSNRSTVMATYILSVSLIPYAIATVGQSISRGYEKLNHIAITMIAGNAFKIVIGLIILVKGYGLASLMITITASYFVISIISYYLAIRLTSPQFRWFAIDTEFCKWIIGASPVFGLILILGTVRSNIDSILLNAIMGEREVGLYSAAYRLVNMFSIGIGFYIMGAQPVLFGLYKTSLERFRSVSIESIRYFIIALFPVVVVCSILNKQIILFLFTEEFLPSAQVLSISIWIIVIAAINQVLANVLIASHNQKVNLYANIVGLVANIVLNLVLVPRMSMIGAGIANTASAVITMLFQNYYVSNHVLKINYLQIGFKTLIASFIMAFVMVLLGELNPLLIVPLSVGVYFLCLLFMKEITIRDVQRVRKIFVNERKPNLI